MSRLGKLLVTVALVALVGPLLLSACGSSDSPADTVTRASSLQLYGVPVTAAEVLVTWPYPTGTRLALDTAQDQELLQQLIRAVEAGTPAMAEKRLYARDLTLVVTTGDGSQVELSVVADDSEVLHVLAQGGDQQREVSYLRSPEATRILEGLQERLKTEERTTAERAAAHGSAPLNDQPNPSMSMANISYILDVLRPDWQVAEADAILWGTVVDVLPARYNSPDGRPWSPPEEDALPVVHTTFLVQAQEIIRGEAISTEPVPVRWMGGAYGQGVNSASQLFASLGIMLGDQVLIFGTKDSKSSARGFYPSPGYWLLSQEHSLFIRQGEQFLGTSGPDGKERVLTVEQLRELAKAGAEESK